jgi:hypothetical protein
MLGVHQGPEGDMICFLLFLAIVFTSQTDTVFLSTFFPLEDMLGAPVLDWIGSDRLFFLDTLLAPSASTTRFF